MIIIDLLTYAILGFMVAKWFKPIQWLKSKLKVYNLPYNYVLYCPKCITFWGTLIYTQDIRYACISSLLSYAIAFAVGKMEVNWEE